MQVKSGSPVSKMLLMVNFTEITAGARIEVKPLLPHWIIDTPTNSSLLSFFDTPAEMTISGSVPDSPKAVLAAGNLGGNMDTINGALSIIGLFSVAISIVSAGAPSGPIIQIIRLFKIFFR
jgi:hypothetical protein